MRSNLASFTATPFLRKEQAKEHKKGIERLTSILPDYHILFLSFLWQHFLLFPFLLLCWNTKTVPCKNKVHVNLVVFTKYRMSCLGQAQINFQVAFQKVGLHHSNETSGRGKMQQERDYELERQTNHCQLDCIPNMTARSSTITHTWIPKSKPPTRPRRQTGWWPLRVIQGAANSQMLWVTRRDRFQPTSWKENKNLGDLAIVNIPVKLKPLKLCPYQFFGKSSKHDAANYERFSWAFLRCVENHLEMKQLPSRE